MYFTIKSISPKEDLSADLAFAADLHHKTAKDALATARDDGHRLVIPASAFAESLIGPSRRGKDAVGEVRQFVKRLPIEVIPLDESIALAAAELRARHGGRLKLPDALVVATAKTLDVDVLITTDKDWPSRSKLGLRASSTSDPDIAAG